MKTLRIKIAGSGGQGVLALGLTLAQAAVCEGLEASWLPSYGPEQRGGSANCSVVISGESIVSPVVGACDILVCLNRESYARFAGDVIPDGLLFVDEDLDVADRPNQVRVPARRKAAAFGLARAANTVFLAAVARHLPHVGDAAWQEAIRRAFAKKPDLADRNLTLFRTSGV